MFNIQNKVLILLCLLTSCGEQNRVSSPEPILLLGDTIGWSDSINIDFQSGYSIQDAEVWVNNNKFKELKELWSDPALGIAESIRIPIQDSITVVISDTCRIDTIRFQETKHNFLGISRSYSACSEYQLLFKPEPFTYE